MYFRMNHEHVTLSDLLEDRGDPDIAKLKVIVQVIERISERIFVIGDPTMTANIEFDENTIFMAKKLKEMANYKFCSQAGYRRDICEQL